MGTRQVGLSDIEQGPARSRRRLLAPLNYLRIKHPEKTRYDVAVPFFLTAVLWVSYLALDPKPAIFGPDGVLKFTRDLLIMAVPFMVGALASVAMGMPGSHIDKRTVGAELILEGEVLTLRQFVCHLLGYLSFVGLITLAASVGAELVRPAIATCLKGYGGLIPYVRGIGALILIGMLSVLSITVLWALYFLTDIVNRYAKS